MKTKIQILLCLIVLGSKAQTNDTLKIKFRTVPICSGRTLTMQADISTISDLCIQSREDHYYLRKGTFGGTDSIDIEVNTQNKIIAISFWYSKEYKYPKAKKVFTRSLGKGKEFIFKVDATTVTATKWQDRLTTFEMVECRVDNSAHIHSIMFDKELFVSKHKRNTNPNYLDHSFEILRALCIF